MSDRIYSGVRIGRGEVSVTVAAYAQDQEQLDDRPLKHIEYHSPDGFEWGYGGSGPADLALSILSDYYTAHGYASVTKDDIWQGTHPAVKLHQQFKSAFIARLSDGEWLLSEQQIDDWLQGMGEAVK